MTAPSLRDYRDAAQLSDAGREPASRTVTIIVARRGAFLVEGSERAAFAVGPRATPITVGYLDEPDCRELRLPPWMSRALLDVAGCDLANAVTDLADLPLTSFRDALLGGDPDPLGIARNVFGSWLAMHGSWQPPGEWSSATLPQTPEGLPLDSASARVGFVRRCGQRRGCPPQPCADPYGIHFTLRQKSDVPAGYTGPDVRCPRSFYPRPPSSDISSRSQANPLQSKNTKKSKKKTPE